MNEVERSFGMTIADVRRCPECHSLETYNHTIDDVEFKDDENTGHYDVFCTCKKCKTNFKLVVEFKYDIIKAYI